MHADGYGGYKKLYGNQIVEAACMAHVRRKFHDVIKLKPSPIADEALSRIGALYDIEDRIRGMPSDQRHTLRQQHARPILEELKVWIEDTLSTLPQKQKLAEAMRYALSRWAALSVYIDDGRVEIDNNIAERAMRPLGIGRKNSYDHYQGLRRTLKHHLRGRQRLAWCHGRDGSERREYSTVAQTLVLGLATQW
jgi:transposase